MTRQDLWRMIIDGHYRSHRFLEIDRIALAKGINALAGRRAIRWLRTTSRRTGEAAEPILKTHLDADCVEDAIWWAEAPRCELHAFMARAAVLCVTQDSVTMVTEAVSAGEPVIAVRPERLVVSPGNFALPYFERLEDNGRIIRVRCEELVRLDPDLSRFRLLEDNGLQTVAEHLVGRLGWNN